MTTELDDLIRHLQGLEQKIDTALSIALTMQEQEEAAAAEQAAAENQQFPEHDLIDTATAARRFQKAPDTIRHWCEFEGIGVKVGGRWKVSVSKLRAKLGW